MLVGVAGSYGKNATDRSQRSINQAASSKLLDRLRTFARQQQFMFAVDGHATTGQRKIRTMLNSAKLRTENASGVLPTNTTAAWITTPRRQKNVSMTACAL